VGPKLFMRSGVIISAVGHVTALLLAVLFTSANPFDSVATEAIAVDIISPSEVPPDQPHPPAPEQPQTPPKEKLPDFSSLLELPPPTPLSTAQSPTTQGAKQSAAPRPREQQQKPQQSASQAAPAAPAAAAAAQGAAKPAPAASPPPPTSLAQMQPPPQQTKETDPGAGQETAKATTVADLFGMPLTLPDGRLGGGFDAPSYETANIERSSIDALRARLKTCAALPAGVSPGENISLVVRVQLKPDGTLAGKPTLIEASASPKGPLLLQSLLGGLTKCQPYNMLPPDKYQEWKSIDMRFTPSDMG
jgi:outer membrane biosynthesis protein TonB